ncbi:MAG: arginine--tRNA ligase [Tissierellia bacterium]|nr:arginine--tRNA ligase [Tissierellia bacterium]
MKDYKEIIAKILVDENIGLEYEEIKNTIETPPDKNMGDYAFPCFKLAKIKRNAPNKIAEEIADSIKKNENIEKIISTGPYLNFFVDKTLLAKNIIEEVKSKGEMYGSSDIGKGKNVVVEFSSTNIAKPFHIGHIRSTVIGNAINKIYKFCGYNTTAVNYIGDYGTQFGMMISAYKLWGDDEKINANPIKELLKLYVDYNTLAKEDPEKMDEARRWFSELENENPEAVELWKWFKEVSLSELDRVYNMLGVEFDSYNGEAFSSQFVDDIIKELREKDLLVKSEGAEIIDLEDENLPNMIVIKSDGSSTYITRDIATAIYRKKEYEFEKNIYVVGSQQILHFNQLIVTLKKMGYDWAEECIHVPFGMVSLKDQTLSTRKGQVVFLEDVLNKAVEKTLAIINERNPGLDDKEEVAKKVGIGAVIFQELFSNRIKDYVFDWDNTLNYDGETGPYVQYTIARANSIVNKANLSSDEVDYSLLSGEVEFDLLKTLYDFPQRVLEAMEKYEPSYITRQLIEIASAFNKFYNSCPILNADDKTMNARLALTDATRTVLKTGLALLGIQSPEKM